MFRTLTSFLGRQTTRRTAPKPPRFRPAVEGLEGRALMAAAIDPYGLTVTGTEGNDTITVNTVTRRGRDYFEVNLNGQVSRFLVSRVPDGAVSVGGLGGNDRITGVGSFKQFRAGGGEGNDTLTGGAGNDFLNGGAGNDSLVGLGGNDFLYGAEGDDYLDGGAGNDNLIGTDGNDTLWGGAGDDALSGRAGQDYASGQDGNDQVWGDDGRDWVDGNAGNDTVRGGEGDDTVGGGDGDDYLYGEGGNDQVLGWRGNDLVSGGTGSDLLEGWDGNDLMISFEGECYDTVIGGAGKDDFWAAEDWYDNPRTDYSIALDGAYYTVPGFANGADRTLDYYDRIADPTDGPNYKDFRSLPIAGASRFDRAPLFGTLGPAAADVAQGQEGDCWLMAGLAGVAQARPEVIRRRVVDFGDGTYGVALGGNFYRVDSDLPTASATSWYPQYAKLGLGNSLWVAVVEKAYAHYRRGENTYSSLSGGFGYEPVEALGGWGRGWKALSTYTSDQALLNDVAARLAAGQVVTIGIGAASGLPNTAAHDYTVAGVVRDVRGRVSQLVLRNPWGYDGKGAIPDSNPNDGYITIGATALRMAKGQVEWASI